MGELILVKPSKSLEEAVHDYKREYENYGEKHINGSCGLSYYTNYDEWLEMVLSIENLLL
jgi:predicted acetyltransferase